MSVSPKILVVEDDEDARNLIRRRLQREGYEVVTAQDGVGCVSMARNESPDLIVLDLGLPAGDGFLSLERLRANDFSARVPVIVLTGQDAAEARSRALAFGASAFFEKGVSTKTFMATVESLLVQSDTGAVH